METNMNVSSHILLSTETSITASKSLLADTYFSYPSCPSRKLSIPRNLDERETLQFGNMVTGKRRVARRASLYRKHDSMSVLYLVRFGQFKLIGGDLNEQRVAGFHMAGDLMGLDAIATGEHHLRLMALENSEVCEFPFAALAVGPNRRLDQPRSSGEVRGAMGGQRRQFLASTDLQRSDAVRAGELGGS